MDKALVDKARKLVSDESRRFEDVVEKLRKVGADIKRITVRDPQTASHAG